MAVTSKDASEIARRANAERCNDRPCVECPLRNQHAFAPIKPEDLAVIDQLKQSEIEFESGVDLIREGDSDSGLFTLLRGWAYRYKTLNDGRRQILNVLLPGDFIGLQQKMDDAASHGVRSLTPVRVCSFRRDAVWALHRDVPALGYDVTWLAAHGERLVDDNLLNVGQRGAHERAAALLLMLYTRALPYETADVEREGILFPLTQQQLADALGLSLIHTHRTLRALQREGLYEWNAQKQRLRLPDPRRLAKIGHLPWPLELPLRPLI
jgi:CRP/FNR family transcriptional regulator